MELQHVWQQMHDRAATDAAFRAELQANPEGVFLREVGMSMVELQRHAEQMSDADLGQVTGGTGDGGNGGRSCSNCGQTFTSPSEAFYHPLFCTKNTLCSFCPP